jgi:hypothetical protein
MANFATASEVDLAPFSGESRLSRGLLQLPSYLLSKEAAFPVLSHHFTDLVLGVVPRI